MFASPEMEERLEECFVPEFTEDSLSDHMPVIADLKSFS
jgi:exonuclease III